jgi:replication-associated recombination protein RarA
MRPEDFAGLVGQREAAEMMCGMTESGTLQSVILWGPPGSCHDPKPETQNPDP